MATKRVKRRYEPAKSEPAASKGLQAGMAGSAQASAPPGEKKAGIFSFADMPQGKLALITLAFFVAIMLVSNQFLKPELGNPQFATIEGAMTKNAELGISDGENYTYLFTVGNDSINLTYIVLYGSGCTIVSLTDGHASVCLRSDGTEAIGQNSTYSVPTIFLIKPWMLAVNETWKWNVSSFIVFQGFVRHVSDTNYTTIRTEYYRGRKAFVVKIASTDNSTAIDWVDAEKRILLREIGPGYETVLTGGSIEIEPLEGVPLNYST